MLFKNFSLPLKYFLETHLFDIVNKVDTHRWLPLENYKFYPKNFKYSVHYQSSWTSEVINCFNYLYEKIHNLKDFIFVDVGCGKGKTLIVWNQQLFIKKIKQQSLGIEYYKPLLSIAKKNFYKLNIKNVKLINKNILDVKFKEKNYIFYLYNPFDKTILINFIKNIKNINFILIYNNPVHRLILSKKFNLKIIYIKNNKKYPNLRTVIYSNTSN
jgi:SAM-dependent methyltransferase